MWAWPTFGCSPITTTRLSLSLNLTGACSRGKIGLCESSRSQTRYFASRGLIHHEQNLVVVLMEEKIKSYIRYMWDKFDLWHQCHTQDYEIYTTSGFALVVTTERQES